ncbi:S8 family serine peptidase [Georgenia sp. SUBG003]|uniref:S8 family serine peptidase n=1 Tax=Georgenia sp. SUBG003 TaxID=1497974 RepID=UPI003AB34EC2
MPDRVHLAAAADPADLAEQVLAGKPDLVVVSPGVPAVSPLHVRAAAAGVPVWSEVELAWRLQARRPDGTRAPWLTLTGTNGKTTTVSMLASILTAAGEVAPAVGNVGTPIVRVAAAGEADVLAVELSSFQLHSTHSVSPQASACLNIAPDHIDWHGSYEAYRADKARVYERTQLACVYNEADPATRAMVEEAEVVEGARAVGTTLRTPSVGQLGLVEEFLVDRAFVAERRTSAAELATRADLAHLAGPWGSTWRSSTPASTRPHPDLDVRGGVDCSSGRPAAPGASLSDQLGHGTLVAGVLAARDNGFGVVGTAPGAPVWSVRVADANGRITVSGLVCAVDWVTSTRTDADPANDIAVANISIAGSGRDDGSCGRRSQDALHAAICGSVRSGVAYVVAAGNASHDLALDIPASYDEVLAVTALADTDGRPGGDGQDACPSSTVPMDDDAAAPFSNFAVSAADRHHTVAAPGACITSTAPRRHVLARPLRHELRQPGDGRRARPVPAGRDLPRGSRRAHRRQVPRARGGLQPGQPRLRVRRRPAAAEREPVLREPRDGVVVLSSGAPRRGGLVPARPASARPGLGLPVRAASSGCDGHRRA